MVFNNTTKQQASKRYANDGIPLSMMQMTLGEPSTGSGSGHSRKSYLQRGTNIVEKQKSDGRKSAIKQSLASILGNGGSSSSSVTSGDFSPTRVSRSSSAPGRRKKQVLKAPSLPSSSADTTGRTNLGRSKSNSARLGAMQRSMFHTPTNLKSVMNQDSTNTTPSSSIMKPSPCSVVANSSKKGSMPEAPSLSDSIRTTEGQLEGIYNTPRMNVHRAGVAALSSCKSDPRPYHDGEAAATTRRVGRLKAMQVSLCQSPADPSTPKTPTYHSMISHTSPLGEQGEQLLKDSPPPPMEMTPQQARMKSKSPKSPSKRSVEVTVSPCSPLPRRGLLRRHTTSSGSKFDGMSFDELKASLGYTKPEGAGKPQDKDISSRRTQRTASTAASTAVLDDTSSRRSQRSIEESVNNDCYSRRSFDRSIDEDHLPFNDYSSRRSQRTDISFDDLDDGTISRRSQRSTDNHHDDDDDPMERVIVMDIPLNDCENDINDDDDDDTALYGGSAPATTATTTTTSLHGSGDLSSKGWLGSISSSTKTGGKSDSSLVGKRKSPLAKLRKRLAGNNEDEGKKTSAKSSSVDPKKPLRPTKSCSLPSRTSKSMMTQQPPQQQQQQEEEAATQRTAPRPGRRSSAIDITSDDWFDMELDLSQFANEMENSVRSRGGGLGVDSIHTEASEHSKRSSKKKHNSISRRRSIDFGAGDDAAGDASSRGGSPHRRGGSPHRRAGSPHRRGGSPHRRAGSPHRRAGSPHRRAGSPLCRAPKRTNSEKSRRQRSKNNSSVRSSRSVATCDSGDEIGLKTPIKKQSANSSQRQQRTTSLDDYLSGGDDDIIETTPTKHRGGNSIRSQRSMYSNDEDDEDILDDTPTYQKKNISTRSRRSIDCDDDIIEDVPVASSIKKNSSAHSKRFIDYNLGAGDDDIIEDTPFLRSKKNTFRGGKRSTDRNIAGEDDDAKTTASTASAGKSRSLPKRSHSTRSSRSADYDSGDDIGEDRKTRKGKIKRRHSTRGTRSVFEHSTRSTRSADYDSGDDIGSATSSAHRRGKSRKNSNKSKKQQDPIDVINDEITPPWLAKALETEQVKNLPVDTAQEAIPEDSSLQGSLILPDENCERPKKPRSNNSIGPIGESSWRDLEFDVGIPSQYVVTATTAKRDEASVADSKSKSADSSNVSIDTRRDEKDTSIRSLKPVPTNGKPNEYSIGSIMDGFPKESILDQTNSNANPAQNPGESTSEMGKHSEHGPGATGNVVLKDIATPATAATAQPVGVADCARAIEMKTKTLQTIKIAKATAAATSRKSAHSKDGDGSLCGMEIQVGGAPMSDKRKRLLTKLFSSRSKNMEPKQSKNKWEMRL